MSQDAREILSQAVRLHQSGQLAEAQAIYRKILADHPQNPDAMHLLGYATFQSGNSSEGLNLIRQAISLNASRADYHCNLGVVLAAMNRHAEAIQSLQTALSIRPNFAEASYNLGVSLRAEQRSREAAEAFRQALIARPGWPEAQMRLAEADFNLAGLLYAADKIDEAISAYRESLQFNLNQPLAHYQLSMLLLRRGDFAQGWPHYEFRWQVKDFNMERRQFGLPEWKGEELQGQRVLIQIEQGYGDLIQFVRYVPLIVERGGKVCLECHPQLARLISSVPGIDRLVEPGPKPADVDLWCPIMSLPRIIGTSLETIPAKVPYLWFNPQLADEWRERLGSNKRLRVGLAWYGRPNPQPLRSIPLEQLAPLADLPGVRFISLQVGDAAEEIARPPSGLEIENWKNELRDFADTAALMANLDLVVTIDTATAHLAGALARPTWLVLFHKPDWRWMIAPSTCPWYPTMRLFRQPAPGDWATPVKQIASELRTLVEKRTS